MNPSRDWKNDVNLIIHGHLDAIGTLESPIYISSLYDDEWGGDTDRNGAGNLPSPGPYNI